jgi:hypothetical protein
VLRALIAVSLVTGCFLGLPSSLAPRGTPAAAVPVPSDEPLVRDAVPELTLLRPASWSVVRAWNSDPRFGRLTWLSSVPLEELCEADGSYPRRECLPTPKLANESAVIAFYLRYGGRQLDATTPRPLLFRPRLYECRLQGGTELWWVIGRNFITSCSRGPSALRKVIAVVASLSLSPETSRAPQARAHIAQVTQARRSARTSLRLGER